jgi:hypothetical protein
MRAHVRELLAAARAQTPWMGVRVRAPLEPALVLPGSQATWAAIQSASAHSNPQLLIPAPGFNHWDHGSSESETN